uniref:Putative 6-Pyruvoyl tetrahydrobiopterin synthase n=1 Tax=viral metagenome TaxID=1070528 RepID=A0A6M3M4T7_9ZZZZ
MTISITKEFEFHAAHHLPEHKGGCKNVHGHSYILKVELQGTVCESGSSTGMIIDFGDLKQIVNDNVIDKVDHRDLNMLWRNPTAEVMVESIAYWIAPHLPKEVLLTRVRLWETRTSYAEWRAE